jgi:ASC-1-like (ASCH) protein
MIVTVYIDESGTHESSVTILGGWVGRLGQWANFDPKWRRLLKRSRPTYFHSKKLRHSKGKFKGWSITEKQAFMAKAAKFGKELEFGFTIILADEDYQQHYVAGQRPKEVQLDTRYGICFRYCLGMIPPLAMQAFGTKDLEISFVLESGHQNFGDAERIFKKVKESREAIEQEIVKTLKSVTAGDKIDFAGLQIADVVAYNSFQHVTRKPFPTTALLPDNPMNYMTEAKKRQRVPLLHLKLGVPEL